ncbi:centromere-associated protein E-like isoform X2 [Trichoplusia ni]|uniref:Centromere-associated protein E-like isoform X2 n=1 Tax=Trichoplusia ni TaxID=7111 RepID=A0A7E5X0E5_TRINI|nr:centromere-associated protein E-like isoform X2 [Trichoplusia ni]
MSDNIKVVVKVRPLISREIEDKLSYQWQVKNNKLTQLDHNGKPLGQCFTFDKVYDQDAKTSDVYEDVAKPIVEAATAGFNGTIFAYGQTSSGKTYTMTGTESAPGIIPLAVLNLFEIIKNAPNRDFLVRVSYIEIYNETINDLLCGEKKDIKVMESIHGLKIDSTVKVTSSPEEVLDAIKEGEANRQKGATIMNEQSSRSHSIFQITIESREHVEGEEEVGCVNVSQLNLVDLAGSERAGQTGATGMRFKEGTHINKSLSSLALVIKQLSENNQFVNYRDSKLTRILQNSLGGNAKTSIICAVTPAAIEETISTLQFANRAKAIKNKPEVNEVSTDKSMIQSLTKEMSILKAQLESKKTLEQDNYKLQNKIANLQKLILNGFAQRRSVEIISGPRRKLQQPRRITISTLHTIEDEPIVPIPKFCTPSLKYNPQLIPVPPPSRSSAALASVAEEAQLLTTPPKTRAIHFSGEVIELDSDDDTTHDDGQTCSPIHKCYGSSKTPPCVLRKNVKEAEKNLKDIVEWTEREKMYAPSVVEYMEKLEQNMSVIATLRDDIERLSQQSKEKDSKIDQLQSKINKAEEDIKVSKIDQQRLAEWEISYETLRIKAKRREEELLSLLEEISVSKKKPEEMGKLLSRTLDKEVHFMDISKDISLVNSDNESSIVNTNDDDSDPVDDLLASEAQLTSNKNIIDLEADLYTHKQKITALENLSQELQEKVNVFKDKIANVENENSLLKSTIETLNSTIRQQKESLESANNDMESYNKLIQELHIKLTKKETLPRVNINDSVLESMIANEEKFIANNENMKNIVHSLKTALDKRNKEIDNLKTQVNSQVDVTGQLDAKTKEIDVLKCKINDLEKNINENIAIINKLMHEKNDLKDIETQLSEKLASVQEKLTEQEHSRNETEKLVQNLKDENGKLTFALAEKNITEVNISDMNKQLLAQIDELKDKIFDLEKEIATKDDLIHSLQKDDEQTKECLLKAKSSVIKSKVILGTLSGNIQEVPDIIDNFVNIFNVLSETMNTLENVANEIVAQKEEVTKNNTHLNNIIEELKTNHDIELTTLREQLGNHKEIDTDEIEAINKKNNELTRDLQTAREDLDTKILECKNLEEKLNQAAQNVIATNEEITVLKTNKSNLDQMLLDKDAMIAELTEKLEEIDGVLQIKVTSFNDVEEQLNNLSARSSILFKNVFTKVTEFADSFTIQIENREENHNDCVKIYEQILESLDKIKDHITIVINKNVDEENLSQELLEAKKEIVELSQQNVNLLQELSNIENSNKDLSKEAQFIQNNNNKLSEELLDTQNLLKDLQSELKLKANDLAIMETKVRDWKDQFTNLDYVMKQQISELQMENESLKSIKAVNTNGPEQSVMVYQHADSHNISTPIPIEKQIFDLFPYKPTPSLATICNNIIDSIQPKEIDSHTTTISSNAPISVESHETYVIKCNCSKLKSELEAVKDENARTLDLLAEMKALNENLIRDQEEARNEIQLLVGPALELQKKIMNHKTNLSILTATTYAENKSLKSQIKVLQHHHSRFHNVCQRDIPDFKKQLRELVTLLQGDPNVSGQHNTSYKRYSLPDVLDNNTSVSNFKNDSTLDGDLLMLDTNVTLTTAADNTLAGHDQTCLNLTQFYDEVTDQTDLNQVTDQNLHSSYNMDILSHDNQTMCEKLSMLKDENYKLRELVDKYTDIKHCMTDAQNSQHNTNTHDNGNESNGLNDRKVTSECVKCKKVLEELRLAHQKLNDELKCLIPELLQVKAQKADIEKKLSNLLLETPQTEDLVKKLNSLEKEYNSKIQENESLKNMLSTNSQEAHEKLNDEVKSLSAELLQVKAQKAEIEQKYSNLVLETPQTDILVKKLTILEKDYNNQIQEIEKLKKAISAKNQEINSLQNENDSLSNQVMESISEVDDLSKQLKDLEQTHTELLQKYKLEQATIDVTSKEVDVQLHCSECLAKDEFIRAMQSSIMPSHTKLNRSLSDSETSSRCNMIVTLQSELDAGREDCKVLTEDVVTIKNHLERNNLSMDLDVSMEGLHREVGTNIQSNKCTMPDIPEERVSDIYTLDRTECVNYFLEKTGVEDNAFNSNVKIIELMRMFYDNMVAKHGTEVENLTNRLKHYEEFKKQIQDQYNTLVEKHSQITTELEKKDLNNQTIADALTKIKSNINILSEEILNTMDTDDSTKLIDMFKENLKILDKELSLSSTDAFDYLINKIVNKQENDLTKIVEQSKKLKEDVSSVTIELNSANHNLAQMKDLLSAKESEFNLIKAQKEKIHEISNAVTLDIIKRDREITETMTRGYQKLVDLNIVDQNIDLTVPFDANIHRLFDTLINQHKNTKNEEDKQLLVKDKECLVMEKDALLLEVRNLKQIIEEKQADIEALQDHSEKLQESNNAITMNLIDKDTKLQELKTLQEDLNKLYKNKVEENNANMVLIQKLTDEVNLLKADLLGKENSIKTLEATIQEQNQYNVKDVTIAELMETVKGLHDDIAHLKAINEVIVKEKETYASELLKSSDTIKQNNLEMDKMTSDILVLKESIKDNAIIIDNLNMEAKKMLKQNMDLKEQLEVRIKEHSRLETNLKTHEDTAQIQTRMIMRLEKQKSEDEKNMIEKNKQIEELTNKYVALQKLCESFHSDSKVKDEIQLLRKNKEALEARVSELESLLQSHKPRLSLEAIADSSRRRRQSLIDSNRMFTDKYDLEDHNLVEAVFESRAKPDDLFMDVDEDVSNRSTPIRLSKGRESLSLSRTDQSEKEEDHPSRPSSVVATRRRRQSTHDLHRSVVRHTPSPLGLETSRLVDECHHSKSANSSTGHDSEVSQLKERLSSCQQELEDLKEKYRELDEECETCAEYLRERDEQCGRLKKERTALQATIAELKTKLANQTFNPNQSQQSLIKPTFSDVAVNTDEDWTNLHSVVVDRMSFDAEVEKNKKLTKSIEELRFKKQDLKNMLAKMQKAIERSGGSRELESVKAELSSCKQELATLRERYRELDEECDTCAQYLREREQQCRELREAKAALEARVQELQCDSEQISAMTHTTRKKRQSLHDQHRPAARDLRDAATETSDDFLSYQVERDGGFRSMSDEMQAKEMKRLRSVVEVLSQQKAVLEQQLVSAALHPPHAMYVATGSAIVQNQQLTDVMKENQKLKKYITTKLHMSKKRGKESNRENEDPTH